MDQNIRRYTDFVICIDASSVMLPNISKIKEMLKGFYQNYVEKMDCAGKIVQQVRTKLIIFRDSPVDKERIIESPFYTLVGDKGNQIEEFHSFIDGVEAYGETSAKLALETLARAFKSKWCKDGDIHRHATIMFTLSSIKNYEPVYPNWPSEISETYKELRKTWDSQEMNIRAKRLLIYAPDYEPWTDMVDWDNTAIFENSEYDCYNVIKYIHKFLEHI